MVIEGAERDEIDLKSHGGDCLKRPKKSRNHCKSEKGTMWKYRSKPIIPTSVHWGLIYAVTQILGS